MTYWLVGYQDTPPDKWLTVVETVYRAVAPLIRAKELVKGDALILVRHGRSTDLAAWAEVIGTDLGAPEDWANFLICRGDSNKPKQFGYATQVAGFPNIMPPAPANAVRVPDAVGVALTEQIPSSPVFLLDPHSRTRSAATTSSATDFRRTSASSTGAATVAATTAASRNNSASTAQSTNPSAFSSHTRETVTPAEALTDACDAISPPASKGLRYLLRAAAYLGDQKNGNSGGIVSPACLLFTMADAVEQSLALGADASELRSMVAMVTAVTSAPNYSTSRREYAAPLSLPGLETPSFPLHRFQFSKGVTRLLGGAEQRAKVRVSLETTIEDVIAEMIATTDDRLRQLLASFNVDTIALAATISPVTSIADIPSAPTAPAMARYDRETVRPGSPDLLGVTPDVETFARFIAARATIPPLAVGIFGDWGHGKSFFLQSLKQRVAELASSPGKSPHFCCSVAQIEFNAWHYMEADLWASLADHLFTELAAHLNGAQKDAATPLLEKLESVKAVEADARRQEAIALSALGDAERALKQVQGEYATALSKRDVARVDWRAAGRAILDSVLNRPELREAWIKGGFRDLGQSAAEVEQTLRALNATAGDIRTTLRGLLAGQGLNRPLLWWTAAALAVAQLPLNLDWWQLDSLGGLISSATTTLGAAAAMAKVANDRAQTALASLKAARGAIASAVDSEHQRVTRAEAEAQADVAAKAALLDSARAAHAEASRQMAEAQHLLRESTPQERMRRFLAERVTSGTYASKLGVIASIRKDIETLSALLDRERHPVADLTDEEDRTLPRLDRIVLYIDDLDRCPEQLVVKVLQAIHLLLAFDLFIVVVAVDVRWLLRSLKQNYPHLLDDVVATKEEEKDAGPRPATARDYLEKIFQVPYWIRPMDGSGTKSYVQSLLGADVLVSPAATREKSEEGNEASAVKVAPQKIGVPPPDQDDEDVEDENEDEDQAANAMEYVRLTSEEMDRIAGLASYLGGSPRRVKRFINLYRLIKMGLSPERLAALAKPEAMAALLVNLTIATGAPRVAPQYFLAVDRMSDWKVLRDYLTSLEQKDPDWQAVQQALNEPNLSVMVLRDWSVVAQRYSFTTGLARRH